MAVRCASCPCELSPAATTTGRVFSASGQSLGGLASAAHVNRGYVGHVEHGQRWPSRAVAAALDDGVSARGALLAAWTAAEAVPAVPLAARPGDAAELEALELARRVAASDLGGETLARLEAAVDELATAYPVTAPAELLGQVRAHLGYVRRLTDARATLDDRRRLLVVGGWLALLAATLVGRSGAAATGARLARHRRRPGPADRARRDSRLAVRDRGVGGAHRWGLPPGAGAVAVDARYSSRHVRVDAFRLSSREIVDGDRPTAIFCACQTAMSSRSANDK